ncbi:MAG TPA: type II toxin-antitoxin system prevent-host-death family antitoxin [Longimicrobium sp.]|nr:type II toxin-antitoxin system prevent-host-death family antitoxin [Longimicrobium sp.]
MVTLAIELDEAEAQFGKLVQRVRDGAEVVITRDGAPWARLVSAEGANAGDRVPGSARGLFTVPDDFDAPLEDFRVVS